MSTNKRDKYLKTLNNILKNHLHKNKQLKAMHCYLNTANLDLRTFIEVGTDAVILVNKIEEGRI